MIRIFICWVKLIRMVERSWLQSWFSAIWLAHASLIESQLESIFTFVIFSSCTISSGPHGYPAGEVENTDNQSDILPAFFTPVFMHMAWMLYSQAWWNVGAINDFRYRIKTWSNWSTHTIHFYDVGIGGDGLRGPEEELDNPDQEFLVHIDIPEIWENGVLTGGGKHYGHLKLISYLSILTPGRQ